MKLFSFLILLMLERNGHTANQPAKLETKAHVEVAGSVVYFLVSLFYCFMYIFIN